MQLVPQSSRKRRDKLHETLSRVTQHATDRTFAKQVVSTVTESRTNFQLSPTAGTNVSHEFCLTRYATRRNDSYNALVTPPSRTLRD